MKRIAALHGCTQNRHGLVPIGRFWAPSQAPARALRLARWESPSRPWSGLQPRLEPWFSPSKRFGLLANWWLVNQTQVVGVYSILTQLKS